MGMMMGDHARARAVNGAARGGKAGMLAAATALFFKLYGYW